MISDEEILLLYGKNAVISRKGRFVFVHLDRPSRALVHARTESFDPDEYFEPGCGTCQAQKEGGVIVFDDRSYDVDEEITVD
jgi:hypothetical protein